MDRVPCKRFQDSLNMNSLDLIERQLLVHAVIELRGTGRFVTGDAGGGFQITAVAQVLGDAGPPETVSRDFIGQADVARPPFNHLQRCLARHCAAQ